MIMTSEKKSLCTKTVYSLLLLFFGTCDLAYAHKATDHEGIENDINVQAVVVSGRVKDGETGEFVQGVNVIVKGTATGTISNNSWAYKISVSDNNALLVFNEMIYLTQEVRVNDKINIDILLQEKPNSAADNKVLRMLKEYGFC